jgi:23S rRNA U2552 (ribose-2'-O)-methylase RlmE/FtsJ
VAAKCINAGGSYNEKQMSGLLVGCDLLFMQPIEGGTFLQSDFTLEATQNQVRFFWRPILIFAS